ncbi:restriction endonuclease [Stackebrandtia nassauensis]|uniref:Restriction endonuclease n=1 Tax=Stackebrandtia nassauensis (strain DSM 44728 / CIP 108903 / NRRL B-16338 / NBRC 102104 / LLR-40K-21) TaxID=446470 RepID=D3QAX3_STANL|nr:restriction endonuclease [Stackebrandtia nassauensis]ADD44769.1 restriction endonuclease [Stackebrandtia nassauensis DSM 44728]
MRNLSAPAKAVIALVGLILGFAVVKYVFAWIAANWFTLVVGLTLLVGLTVGAVLFRRHQTQADRLENRELERHLESIDDMDLPQFESWIGQQLLSHGFRKVRYVGRSGDFGSNFVATAPAPDTRRVMVRAKPDDGTLSRRGARHIQALGADAHARWKADTAILVTNADLHPLKTAARHDALAQQLGVVLVDRLELAAWVADRKPPAALTAAPAAAG